MSPSPLLALVQWLADTGFGRYIRASTAAVPIAGNFHLLAWVVLVGVVLVVNLSALELTLKGRNPSRIARELWPYFIVSLAVAAGTGVVLLVSNAVSYYFNPVFRAKLACLVAAAFLLTLLFRHLKGCEDGVVPRRWKIVAGTNLVLWFGTLIAGRATGLF